MKVPICDPHLSPFLCGLFSAPYLFNEFNAGLKVHAEIDELPLNAFLLVLLLFEHKHMVIEKLLESLVCVIDTELLESVVLCRERKYML